MDYIDKQINQELIKKENLQKDTIIEEYNQIRSNIDSRDLMDSLLELPPQLNFYIIKNKLASAKSEIEKIKDYVNWYKLFYQNYSQETEKLSLKTIFSKLLFLKYDYREKEDITQLNKLTDTTVELMENSSYAKQNPQLITTLIDITEKGLIKQK